MRWIAARAWLLLGNRTDGPMLRMWEQHRSFPWVKRIGLITMALMAAFSAWYCDGRPWLQGAVLLGVGIGSVIVLCLPLRP
ncbi:MAG: hypothetical protein IPI44_11470 [Sulfuritalea sp.]|nr:hypothetical protein [Sulfuritalea sp.]MBK8119869.1 hypothetical protein [Sulfuritalea sp.]